MSLALADNATTRKIEAAVRESRKAFLNRTVASTDDLRRLYLSAAEEIRRQLKFYADNDDSIGIQRLSSLLRDVERTVDVMGRLRNQKIGKSVGDAVRMGIESYGKPLDIAGIGTGELGAVFGKVHRETVEAVHDFIYADGLNLSDRLWKLDQTTQKVVKETIEHGVILGDGARMSAQKLLRRGEPLSKEVLRKMGLNTSSKIGSDVFKIFTPKGQQNVVHNALRIFRTETARANREGFLRTGDNLDTVVGHRWNLSASHPRPDICDVYATQDLDGLGPGGYLKGNYPILPAHPEDLCFDTPIFAFDEGVN